MKRCPTCNRTFDDDTLSFCLEDGTPLTSAGTAAPAFDPNATISFDQARDTSPPPTIAYTAPPSFNQVSPQISPQPAPPPAWSPTPTPLPPTRQSRKWPWVVGILGVLALLGGGLIVLLVALSKMDANTNTANRNNSNANRNGNRNSNSTANNSNTVNRNTNSVAPSTASLSDDFSDGKWGTGTYSYGKIWYQTDEYHMHANKGGYIVMYGPNGDYSTENATVRVTARSVDGTSPSEGYGLVVHGEKPKDKNELEDYAFLISTGENPQYAVLMHRGGEQTPLVNWTRSSVIRTGTSPNQLEVRIKDKQLSYYINGQYVTSITDKGNFMRGLAGFYTSDVNEVAFDDLEISR
ncbi:MAG TPA: hypothetical protein VGB17_17350 [Pyrinomonadaceae bacterium]|jgi:hypothetical protein